ncbi:MAG TPA: hypothetical protein VFK94_05500, partial [Patescibacteria group bacterium]|nr:hypothetical protein [Patescibacteria group bacterium]
MDHKLVVDNKGVTKPFQTIWRSKNFRIRLTLGLLLLLILTSFSNLSTAWNLEISGTPQNYEVVLSSNGFSPAVLKVSPGSTVTFRSEEGIVFWPASNFHPTHEIVPEFDPRQPIEPGESWSFTFSEPGTWRYHDHLKPDVTGAITVQATLLGRLFGWSDPCRSEVVRSDNRSQKIRCWQKEIEATLQKEGLDQAFQVFAKLYRTEPGFPSTCHDMTHLLGEAAYQEFISQSKIQTSDHTVNCSYGFYHGFIEAMLHSGQGYEKVISYCRLVQDELSKTITSPSAYTRCFHGIGHGIFDTLPAKDWGDEEQMVTNSLAVCELLDEDDPALLFSCSKGVFNALTNAYAFENYGLAANPVDPFYLCRKQRTETYRRACHVDIGLHFISTKNLNLPEAAEFIRQNVAEESSRAELLLAQISQEIQDNAAAGLELPLLISTCQEFSGLTRQKCFRGIIEGIFISGLPGSEYQEGLRLCQDP